MPKISELLSQRFLKKEREKTKMTSLAEKTTEGTLSSFSGIFGFSTLTQEEKAKLHDLLIKYAEGEEPDISSDLDLLASITAEVRAINNQAAILHGERIKRAQEILKRYRDGAFSAWLLNTYGNRQTPYNFLQYYDFYQLMPKELHAQIEAMPRQAIYTLASREGTTESKAEVVKNFRGETKEELLTLIRTVFPLNEEDRRREDLGENAIQSLEKILWTLEHRKVKITQRQQERLSLLLSQLSSLINALMPNNTTKA